MEILHSWLITLNLPVCRSWSNQHGNHWPVAVTTQSQTMGGRRHMCSMLCTCFAHVLQQWCLSLHSFGLEHCLLGHTHHWVCWSGSCCLGIWYVWSVNDMFIPMMDSTRICIVLMNLHVERGWYELVTESGIETQVSIYWWVPYLSDCVSFLFPHIIFRS